MDLDVLMVDESCGSCIINDHVIIDAFRASSIVHDEGPAGTILADCPHPLMLCHVLEGRKTTCSADQCVSLGFLDFKCIILKLEVFHP